MPKVLTTSSNVNCGHAPPAAPQTPGKVQTESTAKLKVNGDPVLLESSIAGKSISGCGTLATKDSTGMDIDMPCKKVSAVPQIVPVQPDPAPPAITAGWSTKLKVGGNPVMLDTLAGMTDGMVGKVTPLTLLSGKDNTSKLTAS